MARLRNKVGLIIGGAAGMGIAAARALAFQDAEVIIADRDSDAAARRR